MAGAEDDSWSVNKANSDLNEISLDPDTPDYREKYKKYEADYVRWLKDKYFSGNNLYGGAIFDKEVTIEGEIIKSSRWPCTQSFINPVQSFKDQSSSSVSTAESSNMKDECKTEDIEDDASLDMDKVDQFHASPDVPDLTADSSVKFEVEALSGPEAKTVMQPSSMEVYAAEQKMQLDAHQQMRNAPNMQKIIK